MQLKSVLEQFLSHPPRGCLVQKLIENTPDTYTPHTVTLEIREIVDDVENALPPPCMKVQLTQITPYRVTAYLHTLKYTEEQSACSIPGNQLLKWLIRFAEKRLIYSVELQDDSTTSIAGTEVSLGPFRKFCTGQTWYEQYGFLPISPNDRWAFQRSFDTVRRCPTSVVASFIWCIVQPFLNMRAGKQVKLKNLYFLTSTNNPEIKKCVHHACDGPLTVLAYETVSHKTLTDAMMKLTNLDLWRLWRFMRRIGLSRNEMCISPMTLQVQKLLMNDITLTKKRQCFSRLAPERRVMDLIMKKTDALDNKLDVKNYIRQLNVVLKLFETVGILRMPFDFIYRPSHRTPKRLTSRCRKG